MIISIVIPCYNSDKSIEILAREISELKENSSFEFELILVNDSPNSLDTTKAIKKVQEKYSFIKGVFLRKNQGQHIALLVGLSMTKGEYIITMDDDLQHPVSEIPKLIEAITTNNNVEAVFAIADYIEKKHSLWRNFASYTYNKVDSFFLKKPKGLVKSPFRIITADLKEVLVNSYNASPSLPSLIINSTQNIINIKVNHGKRQYGKSNYTLKKLISLSLNNTIQYSSFPLKVVGFIGMIGSFFSFMFIMITLLRYFFWSIDFPGYASTVSLISFFGGLTLFSLGIIGEYLIRIVKEQHKMELKNLIKQ